MLARQLALQRAFGHLQLLRHLLLARQTVLEQLAQHVLHLQRQGRIGQRGHHRLGVILQGLEQPRIGLTVLINSEITVIVLIFGFTFMLFMGMQLCHRQAGIGLIDEIINFIQEEVVAEG